MWKMCKTVVPEQIWKRIRNLGYFFLYKSTYDKRKTAAKPYDW